MFYILTINNKYRHFLLIIKIFYLDSSVINQNFNSLFSFSYEFYLRLKNILKKKTYFFEINQVYTFEIKKLNIKKYRVSVSRNIQYLSFNIGNGYFLPYYLRLSEKFINGVLF